MKTFIVDGHCDTLSACLKAGQELFANTLQWDVKRAREAGVRVQVMALYSGEREPSRALVDVMKQIELFNRSASMHPEIRTLGPGCQIDDEGLVNALLHLEGGEAIGYDLDLLHSFYRLGVRSMGLTWNHRNQLADGVGEDAPAGLSAFGRQVIREMDVLGMIVDLAHIARPGFFEVLELASGPVVFSHGNLSTICPHRRNLDDDALRALADHGGIIGLSLVPDFVGGRMDVETWLDHVVQAVEIAGVEHVGLGSDFDGTDWVVGGDVAFYREVPAKLRERGFREGEIENILFRNWMNILDRVL